MTIISIKSRPLSAQNPLETGSRLAVGWSKWAQGSLCWKCSKFGVWSELHNSVNLLKEINRDTNNCTLEMSEFLVRKLSLNKATIKNKASSGSLCCSKAKSGKQLSPGSLGCSHSGLPVALKSWLGVGLLVKCFSENKNYTSDL